VAAVQLAVMGQAVKVVLAALAAVVGVGMAVMAVVVQAAAAVACREQEGLVEDLAMAVALAVQRKANLVVVRAVEKAGAVTDVVAEAVEVPAAEVMAKAAWAVAVQVAAVQVAVATVLVLQAVVGWVMER